MYLYRAWHNTMQGDNLWNHIARHLVGRTAPAIRNRFLRVTQNSNDVNLDNMKRFPDKPELPATFAFNNSHVISLIILPKSSSTIMDITTKVTCQLLPTFVFDVAKCTALLLYFFYRAPFIFWSPSCSTR